jgi:hypothetical protein
MKNVADSLARQGSNLDNKRASLLLQENNVPFTVDSHVVGTVSNWRFHPSIIAIVKGLFNHKDDTLAKGNFGRWNFGGSGPDGSPQPFRIGPIGSVISCPGAGDQHQTGSDLREPGKSAATSAMAGRLRRNAGAGADLSARSIITH